MAARNSNPSVGTLSSDEHELLDTYQSLNEEGKGKLFDSFISLLEVQRDSGRYALFASAEGTFNVSGWIFEDGDTAAAALRDLQTKCPAASMAFRPSSELAAQWAQRGEDYITQWTRTADWGYVFPSDASESEARHG